MDRGATDDALTHFLPTAFDRGAAALIAAPAEGARPVLCSEALIESTVVESKHGTLVPLVNWAGRPIRDLTVTVNVAAPAGRAELASGGEVRVRLAAVRKIVGSGILRRLRLLDLRHGCITDEGTRILAACPDLKNLDRGAGP